LLAGCRNLLLRNRLVQQRSARMLFVGTCVVGTFVLTVCLGSDAFTREQDVSTREQDMSSVACRLPVPGSAVREPQDLRSHDGVLQVDLAITDQKQPDGSTRYCYLTPDGALSPSLRLKPGDLLILRFKNNLIDFSSTAPGANAARSVELKPLDLKSLELNPNDPNSWPICTSKKLSDPCAGGAMTAISSNLHFHGMTVPPVCHQDDVLKTSIQPDDPPFEYRFRVPADAAPGLYWYHPHIHGYSKAQVLGGAYGALIVEGLERANPAVAGLPERVLMIGDQELLNPDAPPSKSEPTISKSLIDRDGDTSNSGTGFGKPAKDLSINHVPVPYPDYTPASITMKPGARELWRVVNASAITYLNLAVLFRQAPQRLGIAAVDGVPINFNGSPSAPIIWVNHLGVPPGGRVEFIVEGPPLGEPALLVTRTVDTGPDGENDPNRALASIITAADAPETLARLPSNPQPLPPAALPWLGSIAPARVRKLYFSEQPRDPNDPNSPTAFFITVDGQAPKPFDMNSDVPDIVVKQGDVEDWIIENRTAELHDFHIHQLHFELVDWSGLAVHEPFLRDTVNVPYFNGRMLQYPSVRLRMDFRDPNIVGTFVYHCHILEHEDGGMMGRIRVEPANTVVVRTELSNQDLKGGRHDAR
jgi:FtsP/CotA-like multicopper oxidase with cupredoxin domain